MEGTIIKQTIFTFSGKARHGKNSSAEFLKSYLETLNKRVLIINNADFLKYLAIQYLNWDGVKDERGRSLLQHLGTEKVRKRFPDLWINTSIQIAEIFEDDFDYVLVGDCRFPNEISRWVSEGYKVISTYIKRMNFDNGLTDAQKEHPSETSLDNFNFDVRIEADTLDELNNEVVRKLGDFIL